MVKKFSLVGAILALLASGVSADSKSGVFVGVNVGVPITTADYSGGFRNYESILPDSGVGYAVGIDVGYKQMFSDKMGLRYYVDYYFNQSFSGEKNGTISMPQTTTTTTTNATISQHLVTANVDFLYNFTSSLGAYVGIGLGYQHYSMSMDMDMGGSNVGIPDATKGGFALPINVGVNYNLSDSQTIDIGAKLNTFGVSVNNTFMYQNGTADLRTFIVKVGYTYTF